MASRLRLCSWAARLNSGVMRGPRAESQDCKTSSLCAKSSLWPQLAAPLIFIESFGTCCGALTFGRSSSAAPCPGFHWLILVHRIFRAKIASAARLRRMSALHNNSFKPNPLRGFVSNSHRRAGRLNSGVRPLDRLSHICKICFVAPRASLAFIEARPSRLPSLAPTLDRL